MMRTSMEVAAYLVTRDWYSRFRDNAVKELGYGSGSLTALLRGEFGMKTIEEAFVWGDTPEGHVWWSLRNREFREWGGVGNRAQ